MTDKPVAEGFEEWASKEYPHVPGWMKVCLKDAWKAALAQQPVAKPGEDAGLLVDAVLEAFKRYMDLSDRASFTLERKVWLRLEDAINDLSAYRAAQRTATEER